MIGTIAKCERGLKGIITKAEPELVIDEVTLLPVKAYVGIALSPSIIGRPWYTITPQVIEHTCARRFQALSGMLHRIRRQKGFVL